MFSLCICWLGGPLRTLDEWLFRPTKRGVISAMIGSNLMVVDALCTAAHRAGSATIYVRPFIMGNVKIGCLCFELLDSVLCELKRHCCDSRDASDVGRTSCHHPDYVSNKRYPWINDRRFAGVHPEPEGVDQQQDECCNEPANTQSC